MIPLSVIDIRSLERQFGDAFYIFDEGSFIANYQEFQRIFKSFYPNYQVSYSFKTNYTPYICDLVRNMGGYAEVVSFMEYELALKLGYQNRIIYNGPNKGASSIEAILSGCLVNIDHIDELMLVCNAARRHQDRELHIGLRVNLDVGQTFISRFGMDEKDLARAFKIVSSVPNLHIVGLQCHISRCRGLDAWKKRTRFMLELADRYFTSELPEYIDLGSGMFGQMDPEFAAQFNGVPSYEEYAVVTAKTFAEHYQEIPEHQKPILFTEPGTTLINKYIDFVGKIEAIKTVRGRNFAILNCSEHNLGETCVLKKLPIRLIPAGKDQQYYEQMDLVGYTCLEQDVMYSGFRGFLGKGDYVQFGNVGGYSNVYKPPFICPNCAMLARRKDGSYQVIKRKETPKDLLQTYVY